MARPRPGWAELDPEDVWARVRRTVAKAVGAVAGRPGAGARRLLDGRGAGARLGGPAHPRSLAPDERRARGGVRAGPRVGDRGRAVPPDQRQRARGPVQPAEADVDPRPQPRRVRRGLEVPPLERVRRVHARRRADRGLVARRAHAAVRRRRAPLVGGDRRGCRYRPREAPRPRAGRLPHRDRRRPRGLRAGPAPGHADRRRLPRPVRERGRMRRGGRGPRHDRPRELAVHRAGVRRAPADRHHAAARAEHRVPRRAGPVRHLPVQPGRAAAEVVPGHLRPGRPGGRGPGGHRRVHRPRGRDARGAVERARAPPLHRHGSPGVPHRILGRHPRADARDVAWRHPQGHHGGGDLLPPGPGGRTRRHGHPHARTARGRRRAAGPTHGPGSRPTSWACRWSPPR